MLPMGAAGFKSLLSKGCDKNAGLRLWQRPSTPPQQLCCFHLSLPTLEPLAYTSALSAASVGAAHSRRATFLASKANATQALSRGSSAGPCRRGWRERPCSHG